MIAEMGHLVLIVSLATGIYAVIASFVGAVQHNTVLAQSGQRAALALLFLLTIALIGIEQALLADDFHYRYVASYSSRALPVFFKVTSLWAGQAGSLLFWVWILAIYTALVVLIYRKSQDRIMPYVIGILMAVSVFFISLLVFVDSPFELLPQAPADGRGLNPLLQHFAMVIHPPVLYLGYVGFAVPYAFGIAGLLSGKIDNNWVRTVRRWTVVPWLFLGLGILLGGKWAYEELGWGGYWAWDPVENAAFMPWLVGTAFIHSIMIQEKKDMLKVWNMVLIILTFTLSIFGTFLTRSGVISSVHSFAQSAIGPIFFGFVLFILFTSVYILLVNLHLLKSTARIESVVSRESVFLINNVVFVGACFAVFWGTIFPIVSEAVRGVKITVGPPWFNSVNVPIFLFVLFLTGVGPLVAWRKSSPQHLKRIFLKPVLVSLAGLVILLAMGITHVYALISFVLSIFVTATIVAEFHRGARARMKGKNEGYFTAMFRLFERNKRRYGGYIVHFAMVLLFVGVTGSAFDTDAEVILSDHESAKIGRYEITYHGAQTFADEHKQVLRTHLTLKRDGKEVGDLYPQRHFYLVQEQPTTEVAVKSFFKEDFYVVLNGIDSETNKATFEVHIKPLVIWVWIGGYVLAIGTILGLLPNKQDQLRKKEQLAKETVTAKPETV